MASLSDNQWATLAKVLRTTENGLWFRSESSGERVTLASLYRRGLVKRRAWRGTEGEADAAHEYRVSDAFKAEWDAKCERAKTAAK